MPREARNELKIDPLPGGRYLLHGYILGKQIRKRSRDFNALALLKAEKETELARQHASLAALPSAKMTRLTYEQIADAEAAVAMSRGRRLVECVAAAERVLPPHDAIKCDFALEEWLKTLGERKRSDRTKNKNSDRVEAFIEFAQVKALTEITPLMCERWVFRKGPADFTRLTDAQVLRAWLNFCVKRRWLAITPFEIDMVDLSATARPTEPGRILTPEQCHALLRAARNHAKGVMLPYCILVTWLFMRDSEAQRITRSAIKLNLATPLVEVDTLKRRTVRYRTVTIPANVLPLLTAAVKDKPDDWTVLFSRSMWATIREKAGLIVRGQTTRGKRRPITKSIWQEDIARHSGISYLFQRTGDIKEVCRQAGNKTDVSFRHYLTLPSEGAADRFYSSPT